MHTKQSTTPKPQIDCLVVRIKNWTSVSVRVQICTFPPVNGLSCKICNLKKGKVILWKGKVRPPRIRPQTGPVKENMSRQCRHSHSFTRHCLLHLTPHQLHVFFLVIWSHSKKVKHFQRPSGAHFFLSRGKVLNEKCRVIAAAIKHMRACWNEGLLIARFPRCSLEFCCFT